MRKIVFIFISILAFSLFANLGAEGVNTIVIDPGHGGKDAGAVGKIAYEKNIVLSVAKKFGKLINENFPQVKVIYTRSDDSFVELRQRGRIANQNHADLFVSIHCNATKTPNAKGFETWIMGNHKNDANLQVAQMENSAILQESNHEENYDNFDPNSPDAYIIFSLYQNAFLDQSLGYASFLQNQYNGRLKTTNRGIKQAGFLVLWACALPSVLTEIGFISNPEEEKYLVSEEGQNQIALSLFNAFKEYKLKLESKTPQEAATKSTQAAASKTTKAAANANTAKKNSTSTEAATTTAAAAKPSSAQDTIDDIPNFAPQNQGAQSSVGSNLGSDQNPNLPIISIQILSSAEDKKLSSAEFANLQSLDLKKFNIDGRFIYCCGEAKSLLEAENLEKKIKELGYKDAFKIAILNGKKISIGEAIKLLN